MITCNFISFIKQITICHSFKNAVEAGTDYHEVAFPIRNIMERGLHGQRVVEMPFPRDFQRVFRTLMESGVLSGHSALIAIIHVSASEFAVSVTTILAACVFRILHHARNAFLLGTPYRLFCINPPSATCLSGRFFS